MAASLSAIVVLLVGLALAASAHGVSAHRSHEAVKPSDSDTRDTGPEGSLGLLGFEDFVLQRRSFRDHQRAVRSSASLPVEAKGVETGEAPVAKAWPEQFTVNFTTKSGAATGFIAYDWSQKRQVVYHGPNSTFCSSFGTVDACQMYEFPGGTYVFIPSLDQCFLSVADVGSLPPQWTTYSEYVGVEEVPGVGLCRSFAFPPTAHVWYETVVGSLPCLFVFPEPSMSYYFLPETFEVGSPVEKYFDFPDYCFSEGDSAIKQVVERDLHGFA